MKALSSSHWCLLLFIMSTFSGTLAQDDSEITIPMPKVSGRRPKHNEYMCVGVPLSRSDSHRYIVGFEPQADPRVAHHMLMYGCSSALSQRTWPCKASPQICQYGGPGKILYAWALNASGIHLPQDVGMEIGPSVDINSLVVQIHYGHPETVDDLSTTSQQALVLHTTTQEPLNIAGIFLMGTATGLKAGRDIVYSDAACKFAGPKPIHPFAFRTHAHSLGQQIVGYIMRDGQWRLIGTRSPQDAQTFYPAVSDSLEADRGDYLAVRCVFNMKGKTHSVRMGPDSEDEMCNFYIMYYTANDNRRLYDDECWNAPPRNLVFPNVLPPLPQVTGPVEHHHHGMGGDEEEEVNHHDMGGDKEDHHGDVSSKEEEEEGYKCPVPIPPGDPSKCPDSTPTTPPPVIKTNRPFIEGVSNLPPLSLGLVEAEDWVLNEVSIPGQTLGQVSAVALDREGNVHILHRGAVIWDFSSFNMDFTYRHVDKGPVTAPTLLKFSSTGKPQFAWGEDLFYLPHGLTIDSQGAFWITDVAMHQVFKFDELGATSPSLMLGNTFKPGDGFGHFCQPASVAVENSGVFYVADGYCNKRILKFDALGSLLETWDQPVSHLSLFIPHKASLNSDQTTLYVADRENSRIVSYNTRTGLANVFSGDLERAVYAVCTNGSNNWPLYGVYGGGNGNMGFTMDSQGNQISKWGPPEGFTSPHDLTVDPVRGAVYVTEIGPNRIWKFVTLFANNPELPLPVDMATTAALPPHTSHSTPSHPPQVHSETKDTSVTVTSSPNQLPVTEHHDADNSADSAETDHHGDGSADSAENKTVSVEAVDTDHHGNSGLTDLQKKRATFNVGIFVAIFVVVLVILIVIFGILREHKYLKKLRLYVGSRRKQAGAADGGGVKVETRGRKGKPLHSLLGPSRPGFSRLKTYDSDSEEEEFPVFNRV